MLKRILVLLLILVPVSANAANPNFRKDFYYGAGADAWGYGDSTIYQKHDFIVWYFEDSFLDTLVAHGVRQDMRVLAYISPTDMYASYPNDSAGCGQWYKWRVYHWMRGQLTDSGFSPERMFYHYSAPTNVVAGGVGWIPGTANGDGSYVPSDSLARVPTYPSYYVGSGRGRILVNLRDPVTRRFLVRYYMFAIDSAQSPNWVYPSCRCGDGRTRTPSTTTYFDGIYLDNMGVGPNIRFEPSGIASGGIIHEDVGEGPGVTGRETDVWSDWLENDKYIFARDLRNALHSRVGRTLYTAANVANWRWNPKLNDPNVTGIDFTLTEFVPNPHNIGSFANIDSLASNQLEQEQNGGGWLWLSSVGSASTGFNGSIDESFVGSLALFYVTRSDSSYFGVYNTATNIYNPQNDIFQLGWRGIMDFDVGLPRGQMFVLGSGVDNNGNSYDVHAREYSNALVLVRIKSSEGSDIASQVDLDLATAYPNGSFRIVNSDGSIGANAVSTVAIGHGQGLILEADYNISADTNVVNVAIVYDETGAVSGVDSLIYSLVNEMITSSTNYSATLIDNNVWSTMATQEISSYEVIVISPTVPSSSLLSGPDLDSFPGGVLSINGSLSLGLGNPVISSLDLIRFKGPSTNFINNRELDSLYCKYLSGSDGSYYVLQDVQNDVEILFHESTSLARAITASCDSGSINSTGTPSSGNRVFLGHHATNSIYRAWSTYPPFRRDIQRGVSFLSGDTLPESYVERNIFVGFAEECGNSWNELGSDGTLEKPCVGGGEGNDAAVWNSAVDFLRTGYDGGYAYTTFNPVGIDFLVPEDSVIASYLFLTADQAHSELGFWDVSVGLFPVIAYGGQLNVPFWYQGVFNGCPVDWKATGFFPDGVSNRYGKSEAEPWVKKGMERGVDIPQLPMDSIRFTNNDWNQGGVISLRFSDSVMNSWVLQGHKDFIMKGLAQHSGDIEIGPSADRMGSNAIFSKSGIMILLKGAKIPNSLQGPIAPTQISPIDKSTIGLRPRFEVTIPSSFIGPFLEYQFQVSVDSSFSSLAIDERIAPISTSTVWTPSNDLENLQSYLWRVRSIDTNGTSSWSPIWRFDVFVLATSVSDSIPSSSIPCGVTYMSLRPTLEVNNVLDVVDPIYTFFVATDSFFVNIVEVSSPIFEGAGIKTAWTMNNALITGQPYYWRSSVNGFSPSAFCEFEVQSVPHAAPNPFDRTQHSFVTFHDLPDNAELVIITVDGQTVQRWYGIVGGTWIWDGRNGAGQTVSSQVYLWYIVGTDMRGKLVVQ